MPPTLVVAAELGAPLATFDESLADEARKHLAAADGVHE
jgi:hypothetical protein